MASIYKARGFIGVFGEHIDTLALTAAAKSQLGLNILNAEGPFHITLISKGELRNIPPEKVSSIQTEADTSRIFLAGVGGSSTKGVYFGGVVWAEGQQIRKRLGLPPKQFHITLTLRDDHEIDKGIGSLLHGQFPEHPSTDFLDHLAFTLHLLVEYDQAQVHAVRLAIALPASHRGFLRLADSAYSNYQYKLAQLSYAKAYEHADDERVRAYCIKRLVACSEHTEWGCVFQEHERIQLSYHLQGDLVPILAQPWSSELRNALADNPLVPTLCLESRDQMYLPSFTKSHPSTPEFNRLPRFFRWVIPYHLGAMSTPRHAKDIDFLSAIGIRHVLTLTEETPLPEEWFANKPITNTFLPIPNYHPPSIEQMDLVMRIMEDESKLPILVHCGGGKGRAGTVIACYLAAYGFRKPNPQQDHPEMTSQEAISTLRALRPGSIETSQQEDFVSKWCSTIWKRQSVHPELPPEPLPCPLEIEGQLEKSADLFVLVGLPGSGKSWFSRSLLARDSKSWTRISQDDTGSRSSCETAIGHHRSGKVLLDRCNTAVTDRKQWLELASTWAQNPVCIWFDYDQELCTARAQMRAGHPTLPPGTRVRNAVSQMQKVFARPTLKEGFKAIVIVRSFAAAQDLVLRLSPPVGIYKFPRTSHIINLGAATDDDLIHNPSTSVSSDHVVITEKVDGANMGFSLSSDRSQIIVQNRSHYVNSATHEQFKKLGLWVERHREDLFAVLDRDPLFAERYILFGEWMYATHSIPYTDLPDLFMAFDLYDRSTDTFVDRETLRGLLGSTSITLVPLVYGGSMPNHEDLKGMVQQKSKFWDGRVEGVYVKWERGGKVVNRGKVVRADFIAGNEHWTRGGVRVNGVSLSGG